MCAIFFDVFNGQIVNCASDPFDQRVRSDVHLSSFDVGLDLSEAEFDRRKVWGVSWAKLVNVAMISDQVPNVGHAVYSVVVDHDKS